MIEESEPFALTGVVVSKILQGLTRDVAEIEQFLAQWDVLEPTGLQTYRTAAAIFRKARSKGIALTTIDTLIAAIALEHRASVFTLDQDFSRIAAITGLVLHRVG
jgi:predicted nucleic acid-binding protein